MDYAKIFSTVLLVISITALLFSGELFYVKCSTWNILYFYGYCYLKSLVGNVIIEICRLYYAFRMFHVEHFYMKIKFKE